MINEPSINLVGDIYLIDNKDYSIELTSNSHATIKRWFSDRTVSIYSNEKKALVNLILIEDIVNFMLDDSGSTYAMDTVKCLINYMISYG